MALYSKNEVKPAKIVESEVSYEKKKTFRYYVSFLEYNRRMDVWLSEKDVNTDVDQKQVMEI